MAIEIPLGDVRLTIFDPGTGEWRDVHGATCAIHDTQPGRPRFEPLTLHGKFVLSEKILHELSRPRGMSQSHWRKVYRERGGRKGFDIHVSPDEASEDHR